VNTYITATSAEIFQASPADKTTILPLTLAVASVWKQRLSILVVLVQSADFLKSVFGFQNKLVMPPS